jgi:hypothetical protein
LEAYKHIVDDTFEWTGDTSKMTFYPYYVIKSEKPGPCVNVFSDKEKTNYWANDCSRKFEIMCSNNVTPLADENDDDSEEDDDKTRLLLSYLFGK